MTNFDNVINRKNTDSLKHDFALENSLPEDVLPLWVADMDFKAAPCILDALKKSVEHGIFGYSDTKDDYYEIVSAWFEKYFSYKTEKEWLVKTPGIVYALAMAVQATTEKGDSVIIQPPVYYPFYNVIRNNDRKIIESELVYSDGKYSIDFDDFEKKIIENNVKLFIFCSPHNPVCRVWTKDEIRKLGEICLKHGVYVVSDEIHCDFTWEGFEHTMFTLACPEMKERTIICTAPSKTFNIAGLQMSNLWIEGEALREKYKKAIDSSGYTCPNNLGVVACKAAYKDGRQWSEECKKYIRGNLDFVRSYLKENIPEIKLVEPEGTYFAWLDCSGLGLSDEALADLIVNKAKLWLDAGSIFSENAGQFQRVVLACPKEIIEKAMKQLLVAVKG